MEPIQRHPRPPADLVHLVAQAAAKDTWREDTAGEHFIDFRFHPVIDRWFAEVSVPTRTYVVEP